MNAGQCYSIREQSRAHSRVAVQHQQALSELLDAGISGRLLNGTIPASGRQLAILPAPTVQLPLPHYLLASLLVLRPQPRCLPSHLDSSKLVDNIDNIWTLNTS